MLIGTDGVYSFTFEHEKKPDCPVCGGESLELSIRPELTVEQLIEMLTERQNMCVPPPALLHNPWFYWLYLYSVAKSRSRHCPRRRPRSTSKHHHSWRRPHDQTWRRRSRNWSQTEERSPSRPRVYRSACPFAFHIINSASLPLPSHTTRSHSGLERLRHEHEIVFLHLPNVSKVDMIHAPLHIFTPFADRKLELELPAESIYDKDYIRAHRTTL